MKNKITQSIALVTLLFFTQLGYSQAPKKMSYQAVVRDDTNVLVANTDVGIRISVYSINPNSTPGNIHFIYYFKERHITTTNQNGLFSIVVGAGTLLSGNFNNINWGANEYYISSEIDITGGTNYTISGGQQLMSVPYALYANQSGGGKVLLNGITNPLVTQGTTGDFYINTTTNTLFGPKTTVWPATGVSLVGPQGATGLTGTAGPQGVQGLTGAQGIAGATGATGASGKNTLVKTTSEVAGANCAIGGTKVEVGLDANSNGVLDTSEVNATLTKYVCNGATGSTGVQGPQGIAGLAGAQGATGLTGATGPQGIQGLTGALGAQGPIGLTGATGAQGPIGLTGATGAVGATGAQGAQGIAGATGPIGASGKNTLVKTTAEVAGANCAIGGTKVEVGLDANSNGVLDTSEVNATLTKYVCNGATGLTGATGPQGIQGLTGALGAQGPIGLTGATGAQGPIGLTGATGAVGATGAQGAQGIAGATGPIGASGKNTLVKTTAEVAGANCATGGTKVEVGLDANTNGLLDTSEVNATLTKYVCNGATGTAGAQGVAGNNGENGPQGAIGPAGPQGLQGLTGMNGTNGVDGKNTLLNTTVEPAGDNCVNGGTKIEVGLDVNANGILENIEINISLTKYICNINQNISQPANIRSYSFPDGFSGLQTINYDLATISYPNNADSNYFPYTVPSGKNLYIEKNNSKYISICNSGIYLNDFLISNSTCNGSDNNSKYLIGENQTLRFTNGIYTLNWDYCGNIYPCGFGAYSSFSGYLIDKSVDVIFQSTPYLVPEGYIFIVFSSSPAPIIYTSGNSVPGGTNGYIIQI